MGLFMSGFILALSLCLDIGINNIATVRAGIEKGFGSSFAMAIGGTLGDVVYLIISLAGLSLIMQYQPVRVMIWLGGSLFLFYFALMAWREAFHSKPSIQEPGGRNTTKVKDAWYGFGLTMASPTTILLFATIGGNMLSSAAPSVSAVSVFFIGFFTAQFAWAVFIAISSHLGGKLLGPSLLKTFSLASSVLFFGFAVYILIDGWNNFL